MSDYSLHDRFQVRYWVRFLLFFSFYFVPAYIGIGTAGHAGLRVVWILLAALFFSLALPAILCRHCPHYARKGFFIVCPSTVGPPKLRRYCSEPVSRAEKVLFALGFAAILVFPLPILVAKGQYLFALLTLAGAGVFIVLEQKFSCSRCLNFSCLLNRVPAHARNAWEEQKRVAASPRVKPNPNRQAPGKIDKNREIA